jgi:hypothetical protein
MGAGVMTAELRSWRINVSWMQSVLQEMRLSHLMRILMTNQRNQND